MAFADTQELVVKLDLKGNFNSGVSKAIGSAKSLDKATSRTQASLGKFGKNIERGIAVGAAAAATGFLLVADAAGDFEAQMNTIATIVDRKDIPKIGDALRKTAKDTGIALSDLTSAYYDLASAGVKGELATSVLNDAVTLGIGGLATTAETVDLLTTAVNVYGLDAAGAAKATDQFALAIADGKVKADEIAASFADVASIAKTYGVGIDQIAASYAFLTARGVPATEVATEMQRAIVSLVDPTKDLATAGKVLGVTWEKELRKKGLVPTLDEIRKYSEKTGVPLNALLGRIEAVKFLTQTTGPAVEGFNAELDKMQTVSGEAAKQMAERQKGLNFQLARLKALGTDAAITIGSKLLPKLTPLVEKLDTFINAHQGDIEKFGDDLAAGFEKVADGIGKVDWQPFIDGLKITADIARGAVSAFQSLPDWLQKLVIAGAVVNKVSGGLVTSIGKDIVGALGSQFFSRGSSPANPLFVTQVGGLPGGGGPGGKGPGGFGLGSAAALAGGVLVIGEVEAAGHDFTESVLNNLTGDPRLAQAGANISTAAASGIQPIFGPINRLLTFLQTGNPNGGVVGAPPSKNVGVRPPGGFNEGETPKLLNVTNERLEAIKAAQLAQNTKVDALNASVAHVSAQDSINAALVKAAIGTAATGEASAIARASAAQNAAVAKAGVDTRSETAAVRRAVEAKKLSVVNNIRVDTKVSVRETSKTQTTYKKYYTVAS